MKHIVGISAAIVMACSLSAQADEKVPAPNEKNCSGSTYDQTLASLSKDADRNEFIYNCKSFEQARKHTEWKFEKSPPDDF